MEFRQLIIAQKNTSNIYIFNHRVNLVTSTSLSDELLKENINLGDTSYFLKSENDISIADVFQIKVRIANTGVMMLNFKKDAFNEEEKQNLFNEISALKDDQTPTLELQKIKIGKLIDIVAKYNPIYLGYTNTGEILIAKTTFEEIIAIKDIDFPILVLLPSIGYEDKPLTTKKGKLVKQNSSEPITKKVDENSKGKFSFKEFIPQLKSLDYIFFGVFSIFIAFGTLISGFEIINGEGIAVFLIILSVAFVVTLNYATYKAYLENEYFEYKIKRLIIPCIYVALGLVVGIVIGYLITTYVIKLKEEVIANYAMLYGLTIVLSSLVAFVSLFTPIPLKKLISKIKKNKKN